MTELLALQGGHGMRDGQADVSETNTTPTPKYTHVKEYTPETHLKLLPDTFKPFFRWVHWAYQNV